MTERSRGPAVAALEKQFSRLRNIARKRAIATLEMAFGIFRMFRKMAQ
jgi:hypothetical protein